MAKDAPLLSKLDDASQIISQQSEAQASEDVIVGEEPDALSDSATATAEAEDADEETIEFDRSNYQPTTGPDTAEERQAPNNNNNNSNAQSGVGLHNTVARAIYCMPVSPEVSAEIDDAQTKALATLQIANDQLDAFNRESIEEFEHGKFPTPRLRART
jgi:hypothetical protein